jgi:hypothetical protein
MYQINLSCRLCVQLSFARIQDEFAEGHDALLMEAGF